MTDLSGVGLPPPTMKFLVLLVILGVLRTVASFKCPQVMNQDLIGDPNDCRKYYHCLTDGRYFIKSCPNGLVFEPKTKVCVWDSSRSCAPQILEAAGGDNVVAPVAKEAATSTSKDASSTAKKTTTTTSEKPTSTTKKTAATSKATTTVKVNEQTAKATKQTTSVPKATPEPANETKAPKKTEDDDKKTTTKTETTTADFSTETSSENVTGTSNTTDMRAGENPTNGDKDETSTAATGVKDETTESFKTVDKKEPPKHSVLKRSPFADNRIDGGSYKVTCTSAFAYVTDPDNCHTFYHCNNWRPFQKRCPPGLFFDSQNLVCNWPHNVNCIEGYRAKTSYSFNTLRRRVRPEANKIKKIKVIESTTEKIPFLETIENDVRKIRYEEDTDSTTAQVTVRPWYEQKSSSVVHETSSMAEISSEQTTTTESTTTEATTTPSTPSTSTDGYMYETHPFESRSTWKDWNFDLFYTNSDKQASDLDKLELFSNGKKVQSENKNEFMSTDDVFDTKSSTPASNAETRSTDMVSTSSKDKDESTTQMETSPESESTTTTQALASSSESSTAVSESDDADTTTASPATSTSEPQYTSDDSENMISAGDEYDTKTSEKSDETTSVPEVSSRAPSFDFGTDEDRERNHPKKVQHDAPAPSDTFMTADRFAANQQSMYARDYSNVEDVEIEKFMMKMLNDAMQSKHMVARQASEEYPDNLVDGSYDKNKKTKESEMGGSDALDKWAIADKEGKKSKGTLIEEVTETEAEEIESSGEIENFAADTENQITNLIMKDEAKPAEPETKTTKKEETVTEATKSSTNETKTEIDDSEAVVSNKTLDTKEDNATSPVTETSTTTKATTTEAAKSVTTGTTTTAKDAETTTMANGTETTTKAKVNETTTTAKIIETTTTAKPTETKDNTTSDNSTVEDDLPVKAVPLLKDVSDLCTEKNNCSVKAENKTEDSVKTEDITTEKSEVKTTTAKAEATTTIKSETTTTVKAEATTTAKVEATTTSKVEASTKLKSEISNVTEVPDVPESVNATDKAEAAETTIVVAENDTKNDKTTALPIAKDAAGKVGNDFAASSDNSISKEDKDTLEIDDRHLTLSENATKPDQVSANTNVSESVNTTETTTDSKPAEVKSEANVTNSTTITEIVNSTVTGNDTDVEQTTSADDSSDDASESDDTTKVTSTISLAVETSSQSGKVLTGGSKGTTKKSFISLSDLIKWYLRHWRHYSRWRDSKEIRSAPQ